MFGPTLAVVSILLFSPGVVALTSWCAMASWKNFQCQALRCKQLLPVLSGKKGRAEKWIATIKELIGPEDVLTTKNQGAPSLSTARSILDKPQHDREISLNRLPEGDIPLYQEAERTQWDGSVNIHSPVEAEKVRQQVPRERRSQPRFACVNLLEERVYARCPQHMSTITNEAPPQRVGALLPMPSCLGIGGHPIGSRQGHPRYTGGR